MRNYIFTRWCPFRAQSSDPGTYQDLHGVGANDDDLQNNINAQIEQISNTYPPVYQPWSAQTGDPITVYFLLDKGNLMTLLKELPEVFWFYSVFPPDPALTIWECLANPSESPRNTGWKDQAGVQRKPPPSEAPKAKSGGGGRIVPLLELVIQFCNQVANNLLKEFPPRKKLALIILGFTTQLLAGTITPEQVLLKIDQLLN